MALRADERRDKLRKASGRANINEPEMSEWGNPHEKTSCIHTPIHNVWRNQGTETSKYPEEKKENSVSK